MPINHKYFIELLNVGGKLSFQKPFFMLFYILFFVFQSNATYVGGNPMSNIDPTGLYACRYSISAHTMVCTPTNMSNPTFSSSNFVAGFGDYANNSSFTNISDRGALPIGTYYVGPLKPNSTRRNLTPDAFNQMFGRFAFQTHGCSDPKTCSNGCIAAKDGSTTRTLNYLFGLEEGNNTIIVGP